MLANSSDCAADEPWPGQLEKERENAGKLEGTVTVLRGQLEKLNVQIIDVDQFSNEMIAQIFHYIIKVCRA